MIIHQIWLGPNPQPNIWLDTVKKFCNEYKYEYKLWTENNINFNLKNKVLFDNEKSYAGKSDILRYEILYNFGGIYIDADSVIINYNRFNKLILHYVKHYNNKLLLGKEINNSLLANGVLFASKRNYILKKAINLLPKRDNKLENWKWCGPLLLTDIYNKYKNKKKLFKILSSKIFYPFGWHGNSSIDCHLTLTFPKKSVMFQYGYSTNNLSKFFNEK